MKSFNEAGRDDLNMMEFMIKEGWTPIFSPRDIRGGRIVPENCPSDPVTYEKEGHSIHKHYRYEPNILLPSINDVVGFWARTVGGINVPVTAVFDDKIENLIDLTSEGYVLPCGTSSGKL